MMLVPNRRLIRGVVAAALVAALTAGCGGEPLSGNEDNRQVPVVLDEAPQADQAASIINAIQADATLAAGVPPSVKEKGLRVTTSEGYPPMEMFAEDGTTLIGVDPSLARAIARTLGVKIEIANEDFNAQIPGIISGRYDIVMSTMSDTEERRTKVTFVDYAMAGNGFVVRKGNPENITEPADLCDKTVAVVDNGSALKAAEQYSVDCTKAGMPTIEILKFPGDQEAILQVRNGRAAAGINDYPVAAYRALTSDGVLDVVEIKGTAAPVGIAIKPDNAELIKSMQGALNLLISTGRYQEILKAWGCEGMAVTTAKINGA